MLDTSHREGRGTLVPEEMNGRMTNSGTPQYGNSLIRERCALTAELDCLETRGGLL